MIVDVLGKDNGLLCVAQFLKRGFERIDNRRRATEENAGLESGAGRCCFGIAGVIRPVLLDRRGGSCKVFLLTRIIFKSIKESFQCWSFPVALSEAGAEYGRPHSTGYHSPLTPGAFFHELLM